MWYSYRYRAARRASKEAHDPCVSNRPLPTEHPCPIVLGRPFLRTVGAVIDMRVRNIKFQFPLKKGMEHFPRKRIKKPFDSIGKPKSDSESGTIDNLNLPFLPS